MDNQSMMQPNRLSKQVEQEAHKSDFICLDASQRNLTVMSWEDMYGKNKERPEFRKFTSIDIIYKR